MDSTPPPCSRAEISRAHTTHNAQVAPDGQEQTLVQKPTPRESVFRICMIKKSLEASRKGEISVPATGYTSVKSPKRGSSALAVFFAWLPSQLNNSFSFTKQEASQGPSLLLLYDPEWLCIPLFFLLFVKALITQHHLRAFLVA